MDIQTRISWDTVVKLSFKLGIEHNIPSHILKQIPATNINRWRNEPDGKYIGSELHEAINNKIELFQRIDANHKVETVTEAYFRLEDTLIFILDKVKGKKRLFNEHKDLIVNSIEQVKDSIGISKAIRMFGISRATYQHFKSLVMSKCDRSIIYYCLKKYPQQLLKQEIKKIEQYMNHEVYQYWSASSVYALALREKAVYCCLSTWYKYCNLLGLASKKVRKIVNYQPLVTFRPNQYWCADATRFVTFDGNKYWIHFLMDHFSRKILGFRVTKNPSKFAIRDLLKEVYQKYKPSQPLIFLTDGGAENVNNWVKGFINQLDVHIIHKVAQKDEPFSNSMIEAFNKTFKQEFLNPLPIQNEKMLIDTTEKQLVVYNSIRPQYGLDCNTPNEVYYEKDSLITEYKAYFGEFKQYRKQQNNKNRCVVCL